MRQREVKISQKGNPVQERRERRDASSCFPWGYWESGRDVQAASFISIITVPKPTGPALYDQMEVSKIGQGGQ